MKLNKHRRAPYEGVTGLSLRVAPTPKPLKRRHPRVSVHHGHFTARECGGKRFFAQMGELGMGLLTTNLQLVRVEDHNQGPDSYHELYDWSKVPRSDIGKVREIVFGLVRASSRQVIDIRLGGPRPISGEERQALFNGGDIVEGDLYWPRRALTRFAVAHGVSEFSAVQVAGYQALTDEETRSAAVEDYLGAFIPSAFNPFNDRYEEARRKDLLPPSAPLTPAQVACSLVMREPARTGIFNEEFQRIWGEQERNQPLDLIAV